MIFSCSFLNGQKGTKKASTADIQHGRAQQLSLPVVQSKLCGITILYFGSPTTTVVASFVKLMLPGAAWALNDNLYFEFEWSIIAVALSQRAKKPGDS